MNMPWGTKEIALNGLSRYREALEWLFFIFYETYYFYSLN